MNQVLSVFLGTTCFVIGQIFLKKSFSIDSDFMQTWNIFSITFGIVAIAFISYNTLIQDKSIKDVFSINAKNQNALIAGICFAIGNILWFYSISGKKSLGSIRTIMAGFETGLLFLVGFLLFQETFHMWKIVGILLVLTGIYLVGLVG